MSANNMISKLTKSFYEATKWHRAINLCAEGRHEEALHVARTLKAPLRQTLRWRLLEMHQSGLLSRNQDTLASAKEIISILMSKPALTPDDRYFTIFAQWYGLVAFKELYPTRPVPDFLAFDLASINLADVSIRWKRAFPLRIHPDWDENIGPN